MTTPTLAPTIALSLRHQAAIFLLCHCLRGSVVTSHPER